MMNRRGLIVFLLACLLGMCISLSARHSHQRHPTQTTEAH